MKHEHALTTAMLAVASLPMFADLPTTARTPATWHPVDFAVELYRQLAADAQPDENIVASPYGAASCTALVGTGAKGDTAAGIAAALQLGSSDPDSVASTFREAQTALSRATNAAVSITLSDSLWLAPKFEVEAPFLARARNAFGAEARSIPMDSRGREIVNQFVKDKTAGLIPELLRSSQPDPMTRLLAVDTIHLKADWDMPFERSETCDQTFHAAAGDRDVPFLHDVRDAVILDAPECAVLRLPYLYDTVEMLVALPSPTNTLAEVESRLTRPYLDRLLSRPWSGKANIALPKFTFATELSLKDALARMGMGTAFSNEADFSGISAREGLALTEIRQKAFIRVDEVGTEAAAATFAMLDGACPAPEEEEPPRPFIADRPFLFLVRETRTGLVLFLGRVCAP